jgi:hypothetical protein
VEMIHRIKIILNRWHCCNLMEELHTDSLDGRHEASYGARSRARERAYSNITPAI